MYECHEHNNPKKLAVKVINKQMLSLNEKQFINNEIEIMKTMRHPFIVSYKTCFETPTHLHIVMEHINGITLLDYLIQSCNNMGEHEITKIIY